MYFYCGFVVTLLFILIVYRNSLLFLKSVSGCEHAKKKSKPNCYHSNLAFSYLLLKYSGHEIAYIHIITSHVDKSLVHRKEG